MMVHSRAAIDSKPPHLLAGDRKLASAANERYAQTHGIKQVVLPASGAKSAERIAYERQRWFRRGRNWRAGIEGRISGLKRGHGLDRCRYHGEDEMECWVGWGLSTHDRHAGHCRACRSQPRTAAK
jgi:transposase, IS5 family